MSCRLFPSRLMAASVLVAAPVHAATLTVPGDAPTIQVAINFAASGDEIIVAPGTYFESVDLLGKELELRSTDGAAVTIIDAIGQSDAALHCVNGQSAATVIEGFTLRNGVATGGSGDDRGAGLYLNLTSPRVRDCVFETCTATYGGALYVNGGTPVLEGCVFRDNDGSVGGAIYANQTDLTLRACRFEGNTAQSGGGAIYMSSGDLAISDSVFDGNAGQHGGAIFVPVTAGVSGTVARSSFALNDASEFGGALYSGSALVTVEDGLFVENTAGAGGGALYGTSFGVNRCTILGNTSEVGAHAIDGVPVVEGCIVRGSRAALIGGSVAVTYCNVEGGGAGTGNFDLDPQFVDAANGDYHLAPGSPCIDAGNTTALSAAYPLDLSGAPRAVNDPNVTDSGVSFLGLAVDVGAFEFQPEGTTIDPCPADADGSGAVDFADLLQVLTAWGPCGG